MRGRAVRAGTRLVCVCALQAARACVRGSAQRSGRRRWWRAASAPPPPPPLPAGRAAAVRVACRARGAAARHAAAPHPPGWLQMPLSAEDGGAQRAGRLSSTQPAELATRRARAARRGAAGAAQLTGHRAAIVRRDALPQRCLPWLQHKRRRGFCNCRLPLKVRQICVDLAHFVASMLEHATSLPGRLRPKTRGELLRRSSACACA
jgi:hypothetical protein